VFEYNHVSPKEKNEIFVLLAFPIPLKKLIVPEGVYPYREYTGYLSNRNATVLKVNPIAIGAK